MEKWTIGNITTAVGIIVTLASFCGAIYHFIKKLVLDKIDKNKNDIEILKTEVGNLKSEVLNSKEERLILLKGQLACLKGLKEQGCNGAVTNAISNIEEYLINKSHE